MDWNKEFNDAAIYGDFNQVKTIVEKHPDCINQKDEYGFTVLHDLAGEEQYEILQFLIDHGANVNEKNDNGITPLHLAAWPEIVEILGKNGADLEAKSNNGDTPLISLSAEQESEDVMEALLKAGAQVHARNNSGKSALDIAIRREESRKIRVLKKYGAE